MPPENRAPKRTVPPENWASEKHDGAAGELGAVEVDRAAGELGAVKADRAAGELGAVEVAAVKQNARKVEVQALPGHLGVFFKVRTDDPDDRVSDFPDSLEGKPFRLGSIRPRIGLVRHPQIGA